MKEDVKKRAERLLSLESARRGVPPVPVSGEVFFTSPRLRECAQFLAKKLQRANKENKRVILFGDYDVDGTTSAAIAFLFGRALGLNYVTPFVSRRDDGYGLTIPSVNRILHEMSDGEDGDLFIAMDMGVSSANEARILLDRGYDVLVLDHHRPDGIQSQPSDEELAASTPSWGATAKERWNYLQSEYPGRVYVYDALLYSAPEELHFEHLSAAGVLAVVLITILSEDMEGIATEMLRDNGENKVNGRIRIRLGAPTVTFEQIFHSIYKLCAMALECDCVTFSKNGVFTIAWHMAKEYETDTPLIAGVKVLREITNTASKIAWLVGPIINAAGRLMDAYEAFLLLTETDEDKARERLKSIQTVRTKVRAMVNNAQTNIDGDLRTERGVAILVASDKIQHGVSGIVAARAAEYLGRPVAYLCEDADSYRASMRSGYTDFSCEAWIKELKDKGIITRGGGHTAAAGFGVQKELLQALLASAEEQSFSLTPPPVYETTVGGMDEYIRAVEPTLPFGKGHESAILSVKCLLTAVRRLEKRDTKEVWAYRLSLVDFEGERPHQVLLKAGSTDERIRAKLESLADVRNVRVPVSMHVVAADSALINPRFSRVKAEVYERTVIEAGEGGLSKISSQSVFSFLTKKEYADASGHNVEETRRQLPDEVRGRPSDLSNQIQISIDWNESVHRRVFLLRRPSRDEIAATIGEESLRAIDKIHGGRYDSSLRCHVITSGVIETILAEPETTLWKFTMSPRAVAHYEALKEEAREVAEMKQDVTPLEIPFLRTDVVTPKGFQYADVRLYSSRLSYICHNETGTGKTLEAAMWTALRVSDQKERIEQSGGVGSTRVAPGLLITPQSTVFQLSNEINEYFTMKSIVVTDKMIKSILKHEADGSKKTGAERQKGKRKILSKVQDKVLDLFLKEVVGDAKSVVLHYDLVSRHPWILSSFAWACVALDEAQELKNPFSQRTMSILGEQCDGAPLCHQDYAAPVLFMSATIAKNMPIDWFVPLRITEADGGVYTGGRLSGAYTAFDMRFNGLRFESKRRRINNRIVERTEQVRGNPENGEELRLINTPFTVRRIKSELGDDLPPIEVFIKRVSSSGLYTNVAEYMKTRTELSPASLALLHKHELISKSGDGEIVTGGLIGASRADDDASDFSISGIDDVEKRLTTMASLDKGANIIEHLNEVDWLKPGDDGRISPFVLMAFHPCAAVEMRDRLEAHGVECILMLQSDTAEKREIKKNDFQSGKGTAFITTIGIGGVGLNLMRASRLYIANLPWTDHALNQSIGRIWRLGQKNPCEVMISILMGSVEEGAYYLLRKKGRANHKTTGIDQVKVSDIPLLAANGVIDVAGGSMMSRFGKEPKREESVGGEHYSFVGRPKKRRGNS